MENATFYAGVPLKIFEEIRRETPAGAASDAVSRVLGSNYSGRRAAVRTGRLMDVRVEGRHGAFRAMAVDISRTGILLRILDRTFASDQEEVFLMPYMGRIRFHFDEGIEVQLPGDVGRAMADVVRVAGYTELGNAVVLLGCRFRKELSDDSCRKLDIEAGPDRAPGT